MSKKSTSPLIDNCVHLAALIEEFYSRVAGLNPETEAAKDVETNLGIFFLIMMKGKENENI
jgi:hypothetical protein